ncbi:lipase family protein [Cohnella silvisoli]|uniref:Lipase family protein n=1 Tax=Cohnella silvisoli TaxID=2873699 RepID=A0ABV1KTM4_9BACL|nr:lipase family protein [Cohnella silvisoli]MCD9022911.1 lipase family protein [Cohnella silvisoli]
MPTKQCDDRTAIFLASVCSQTYAQYSDPDGQFVVPESYEVVSTFRAKSLTGKLEKFGFILQSDNRIIVAFRGTSSTTDWISDAIASQSKYKCVKDAGQSHRGISDIYYSVRDPILAALSKLSADKTLFITGHSLGGALATLCGLDMAENSAFSDPVVYTYGSPRVGDPSFARAFTDKVNQSFRINNHFDVVTHLPPNVYKLPKRETTYHYVHVRDSNGLSFHNGSVSGNHVISSYFVELAKRDSLYTEELRVRNPGFCPQPERYSSQGSEPVIYIP